MNAERRTIVRCAIEAHRFAKSIVSHSVSFHDDLCGTCAVTAAFLLKRLLDNSVMDAAFVLGKGHAYVRVGKLLVDVTGMQFGYPSVFVGEGLPRADMTYRHYEHPGIIYDDRTECYTVSDVIDALDSLGWSWDAARVQHYVVEGRKEAA